MDQGRIKPPSLNIKANLTALKKRQGNGKKHEESATRIERDGMGSNP